MCMLVFLIVCLVFFFKQKTAYEMRISDWSSDVCSSDLVKGFISFAGKSGVRGRVVSREGSLVSQALLAGIVGGFGRGFSANANGIFSGQVGANGQREALSPTDILAGGFGQGAGEAADTVSRYLIERAEQYQPVVKIGRAHV